MTALKLIYEGENLVLGASDGKATIAQAEKIFSGYLDPDFKNWGLDKQGSATKEQAISIYEMVQGANFNQMFNSLGKDLNDLCLTQKQIIVFVIKYKNWLRKDGYTTFFLFRVNNEFFVAIVDIHDGGPLGVDVARFDDDYVWNPVFRPRVVIPQL